jgi:hypothetical protein
MSNTQAAALIIQNIEMFEDASKLLSKITEKVFHEIHDEICNFVRKDIEWEVSGEGKDLDSEFWLKSWGKGGKWIASYSWVNIKNDESAEDAQWNLPAIFGIGSERTGFYLNINPIELADMRLKDWKSYLSTKLVDFPEIQKSEFILRNGEFFLPWHLNIQEVADAYEADSYSECLKPVRDALRSIATTNEHFVELFQQTREYAIKGNELGGAQE